MGNPSHQHILALMQWWERLSYLQLFLIGCPSFLHVSHVMETAHGLLHNRCKAKCKWHAAESMHIDTQAVKHTFPSMCAQTHTHTFLLHMPMRHTGWENADTVCGRGGSVIMGQWGRVQSDEKTLIKAISISVTPLAAMTTSWACTDHSSATVWMKGMEETVVCVITTG